MEQHNTLMCTKAASGMESDQECGNQNVAYQFGLVVVVRAGRAKGLKAERGIMSAMCFA